VLNRNSARIGSDRFAEARFESLPLASDLIVGEQKAQEQEAVLAWRALLLALFFSSHGNPKLSRKSSARSPSP